eukprot:TRINITY_DN72238_c0_g1_i1.p1 TRINITY_DN72238_c0_g1~~TRINITY_DN72238_c0_g1_i1.p1  ORF type:complete len:235 (-),score=48.58 TRINITY_DN72238_c0_g1_i1:325-1029(-)
MVAFPVAFGGSGGQDVFRRLQLYHPVAQQEDYYVNGKWMLDQMLIDIKLFTAFRQEAGLPQPTLADYAPIVPRAPNSASNKGSGAGATSKAPFVKTASFAKRFLLGRSKAPAQAKLAAPFAKLAAPFAKRPMSLGRPATPPPPPAAKRPRFGAFASHGIASSKLLSVTAKGPRAGSVPVPSSKKAAGTSPLAAPSVKQTLLTAHPKVKSTSSLVAPTASSKGAPAKPKMPGLVR